MADLGATDAIVSAISVLAGFGGKGVVDYMKESKRADTISDLRDRVTRLESDLKNLRASSGERFNALSETLKEVGVDVKALLAGRRDHD